MNNSSSRIRSIDAFRAVTMFLMIFVNDIEDIPNTPLWIHHAADGVDGMGLADVIFPAFLFIVGLSIPFALKNRSTQNANVVWHIVMRSAILLFWGFWFTNLEMYDADNTLIERGAWQYLSIISMFLIFLDYNWIKLMWIKYLLQAVGVLLLVFLAVVYKSEDPDQSWLHFTWWGILGLIGWAYLYAALVFYFSKGKLWVQIAAWFVFFALNICSHLGLTDFMYPAYPYVWLAGNGAMQAFAMAGVVLAAFYRYALSENRMFSFWRFVVSVSIAILLFGYIVSNSTGGLSKSFETPAWVAVCTGISALCYLVFIFIVDISQKYAWVKPIEAAGIATLMCFMLPDIFYSWLETTDLDYPDLVKNGVGGVLRGLVFAVLIVWLAALLLKLRIKLKV